MNRQCYWFRSARFEIEPGEDGEINPGIYGKQLARWLKARLEDRGYKVEPIINEDWGRCLMCSRDPFLLWVGCGNMTDLSVTPGVIPPKEQIIWTCFATAWVPFWKKLFSKTDTEPAVARLHADLGAILTGEPGITLVEEP
jgi:hypothetical protein